MSGVSISFFSIPLFLVLARFVWSLDAGPVPNEFTKADLIQVKPENEITYSIFCQLNDEKDDPNGAPAIGLTRKDVDFLESFPEPNSVEDKYNQVLQHTETITAIWERSQKGWDVIRKLNTYDQIADLTPSHLDYKEAFYDYKLLVRIGGLHGLLLTAQGDERRAIEPVILLDAIAQKLGYTSRSLITKLVCYGIFDARIKILKDIFNHPNTSKVTVEYIRDYYSFDMSELLQLRNCFVYEYLLFKNEVNKTDLSRKHLLFKTNSFLRYKDNYFREMMQKDRGRTGSEYCKISVWPWESPNWPKVRYGKLHFYSPYFLYNPMGYMTGEKVPAYEKIFQIKTKILIEDDLFQWVLARRMGQEGSLKARAYSDEYTVDVDKGLVFSVGPDGKPYTDDDIKLRINPEVLGLK